MRVNLPTVMWSGAFALVLKPRDEIAERFGHHHLEHAAQQTS